MMDIIIDMFKPLLILAYAGGACGVFLSYFRPGINPNIPIARFEGVKEFVMIIVVSLFWPIYLIISVIIDRRVKI